MKSKIPYPLKILSDFIEDRLHLIALFGFVVSLVALLGNNQDDFLKLPFNTLILLILFVYSTKRRLQQKKPKGDEIIGNDSPNIPCERKPTRRWRI